MYLDHIFVGTGGRAFSPSLPTVLLLHGAGLDHTVWVLLARWFAHHGWSVMAPDLPSHGRSGGELLGSIEAMADWTAALIERSGAGKAALIGHSMGSLVALETAARHCELVSALALINTAARMPVSARLLQAAQVNDPTALEMMAVWGYGFHAGIGGSLLPGAWMFGAGKRLLERARPGVLFKDLQACNDYEQAPAAAAKVKVPVTVVLGERDLMTPPKAGLQLAARLPNPRTIVLTGGGHMLLSEQPDAVLAAVRGLSREAGSCSNGKG